jgi:hypothetical protein
MRTDHTHDVHSLQSKIDALVTETKERREQLVQLREEKDKELEEKDKQVATMKAERETQNRTFQEVEAYYSRNMEALQLELNNALLQQQSSPQITISESTTSSPPQNGPITGLLKDPLEKNPWPPPMIIREDGSQEIHPTTLSVDISELTKSNPREDVDIRNSTVLMNSIPYEQDEQTPRDSPEEDEFEVRVRELFFTQQLLFAKHMEGSPRDNRRRFP